MISLRRTLGSFVAVGLLVGPACTSDTSRFCERLRDVADMTELADAIKANDARGINRSLEELRTVEDVAPKEIFTEFRSLIDVLDDTVRTLTDTTDATGENTPVDPSTLTEQLAKISEPAQKVTEYADKYCGIQLGS